MIRILKVILPVYGFFLLIGAGPVAAAIPVIFDTDIGSDIDDTWALSLLLCSPEVDLKLVVTDNHGATERAKILGQFLQRVRRSDVAVGMGVQNKEALVPQAKWAETYDLSKYPGTVHEDGIQAMIDVIKKATETVRLIVTGPCPNIPVLLQRYPEAVKKVHVYAMSGSVRKGYKNNPSPDAEYNVRIDVSASMAMYAAPWKLTITPLDTCGIVSIRGEQYLGLMLKDFPVIKALNENYRIWVKEGKSNIDPGVRSTILYDTVAVYLAIENRFCQMEDIKLRVDDRGYTVIDPMAQTISVATGWKDLEGFKTWMVNRLSGGVVIKLKEIK